MTPLHHTVHGILQIQEDSESVLEKTAPMDYGYRGEPFVWGQENITAGDDGMEALDYGYRGEPFCVWSNI